MKHTKIWRVTLLHRARLRAALRFAGIQFIEGRGLIGSTFEGTGTPEQWRLAEAIFRYGQANRARGFAW